MESTTPLVPGGEGVRHHCVVDFDVSPHVVIEGHTVVQTRRHKHPTCGGCNHGLCSIEKDLGGRCSKGQCTRSTPDAFHNQHHNIISQIREITVAWVNNEISDSGHSKDSLSTKDTI